MVSAIGPVAADDDPLDSLAEPPLEVALLDGAALLVVGSYPLWRLGRLGK